MRRTLSRRSLPLFLALTLVTPPLLLGDSDRRPANFDVRDDDAKASVVVREKHLERHGARQKEKKEKLQQEMKRAEKKLGDEIRGLEVQHSVRTGAPEKVAVEHGRGKLTRGASDNRERVLRKFLQDNAELYGLEPNEIAHMVKSADYANPAGNLGWVTLERKIKGKSVFRGDLTAAFNAAGELVATTGELPAGIDDADAKETPDVTAVQAVVVAAASVGITVAPGALTLKQSDETTFVFQGGPFSDDTKVELQYFPLDVGAVELAWSMVLWIDDDEAYYLIVGAEIGDVLYRKSIVNDQTQPTTYKVYDGDSPAPLSPSNAIPGSGIQGAAIARTSFTIISEGAFNNLGWMTDGANTTSGNNVDAGLDLVSPNGIDAAGRPVPSTFRVFDFSYNPPPGGSDPPTNTDYRWGEVSNMFFWSNRYHDRLYELGFTEPARNFQQNNFSRGGAQNDRVLAEAQDFSGTNNANFATPPDGSSGRMQMFVFTGPNPDRVSALDQEILIHELTHGTSNRLHNNASGLNATMSGGMGEGWSDFYARVLLSDASEDLNGIYPMGGYSTLQITGPSFLDNYYYGIRRFPYALISVLGPNGRPYNPLTFADIDPAQINVSDGAYPRGPIGSSNAFQVHNIGEVWSSTLLEVRARIINRLGFAAGNQRSLQIVTDGMKLDPVNPTLVDGRNAILQADCAGFAGEDELDIWRGFAARGLGYGASAASAASGTVVQSFTMPSLITGAAVVSGGSCDANDGVADPGETVVLTVPISNPFCATTANNVVASLDGGASVNLGNLGPGQTVNAIFNYAVPTGSCGTAVNPSLTISSSLGSTARIVSLQVGTPVGATSAVNYSTGSISTFLPDVSTTDIPITVSGVGSVADVNVKIRMTHTFDGDLVLSLIAPDGTAVRLATNRGGSGDNFGSGSSDCAGTSTVFDDSAATAIGAGIAPFNGAFRPDSPLSALTGKQMNGTWKLRVADTGAQDVGTMHCVQLEISRQQFYCCGVPGVPSIVAGGSPVVTAESAAPSNGAADPDETVTVQFPLANVGTGKTTNLVATLLSGSGVLAPSAPQSYGAVSPVGAPTSRPFTFVAKGNCGDTITATLALQDGATSLGTVTFTMRVGALVHTPNAAANAASISIPSSGPATPYPSPITVSGVTGNVTKVTARLANFSHTWPDDVDVLLVGPGGQKVLLMSDVGGSVDAVNATITFDDSAPPMGTTVISGTFRPTNIDTTTDVFPAPAPPGPFGGALAAYNGISANGTWQLFVRDDVGGDLGSFAGGWSLTITTTTESCVVQACTLTCPPAAAASTPPGMAGAVVTFPLPSLSGSCGVVTTSPLSGSVFPIGTTVVTGTATRGDGTTAATCSFNVTVTDTQPPEISAVTATPSVITANNHKMVEVTINYTSSDNSGASSVCSLAVASSQPVNGSGDGNTEPDWEVLDANRVLLRAERAGNGTDRVYTITVTCVDAAGNSSSKSTTVTVPHDNRN